MQFRHCLTQLNLTQLRWCRYYYRYLRPFNVRIIESIHAALCVWEKWNENSRYKVLYWAISLLPKYATYLVWDVIYSDINTVTHEIDPPFRIFHKNSFQVYHVTFMYVLSSNNKLSKFLYIYIFFYFLFSFSSRYIKEILMKFLKYSINSVNNSSHPLTVPYQMQSSFSHACGIASLKGKIEMYVSVSCLVRFSWNMQKLRGISNLCFFTMFQYTFAYDANINPLLANYMI